MLIFGAHLYKHVDHLWSSVSSNCSCYVWGTLKSVRLWTRICYQIHLYTYMYVFGQRNGVLWFSGNVVVVVGQILR